MLHERRREPVRVPGHVYSFPIATRLVPTTRQRGHDRAPADAVAAAAYDAAAADAVAVEATLGSVATEAKMA